MNTSLHRQRKSSWIPWKLRHRLEPVLQLLAGDNPSQTAILKFRSVPYQLPEKQRPFLQPGRNSFWVRFNLWYRPVPLAWWVHEHISPQICNLQLIISIFPLSEFSTSVILTFWAKFFFVMGSCTMHYRMFSNTLASTQEMPVTTPPTNVAIKNVFRHCQMFQGEGAKNSPFIGNYCLTWPSFCRNTRRIFFKKKENKQCLVPLRT